MLDGLFDEQDGELDPAKRSALIGQLQQRVLENRHMLILLWQTGLYGGNREVRNYPPKLPFLNSPRYRWEQIWMERS